MTVLQNRLVLAAKIIGGLLLLLAISYFVFRNVILEKSIVKIQEKFKSEYQSDFNIGSAKFEGFSGLVMREISIVPQNADTLLRVNKLNTSVNFAELLIGELQIGKLDLENGYILLVKKGTKKNFDSFIKKNDSLSNQKVVTEKDYARKFYKILSRALNLFPTDMKLKNFSLFVNDNGSKASVKIIELSLADEKLATNIDVKTNTFSQEWRINGMANPRKKTADVRFYNADTSAIKVPYLDDRYNFIASFDTAHIVVENLNMKGDEMSVNGMAAIKNLNVNHRRIASQDVKIENAQFDYDFLFGPDFIKIDSSSTVQINKLKVHPFVEYNIKNDTTYAFKIDIPETKAQDFIDALPKGLFSNFEGMQAEGSFDYSLDFKFNKNKPKDLVFESQFHKNNLKITKYGEANLSKLNAPFIYRAIENGKPQRAVVVGESNPNFTPLQSISPYLRNAVLTMEDPSFFSHNGFIGEAFKQSIIKNIKAKKFARGASTISMQLVKNVFLTREKTLSRKLEEILLVYILENNRITSKSRMFEVYLNIIEWGPNIYGISEASYFYFAKHPSELSVAESIYLASIVPRPKKFMYQFTPEGELRSSAYTKQRYITNIMFRRGLLQTEDTLYQQKKIYANGPASSFFKMKITAPVDNDSIEDLGEFDF